MSLQRGEALPLLDHDEGVLAKPGLQAADALRIDGRAVLDAAVLGMDRGHVGAERRQDLIALTGFGGNDREHMSHRHVSTLSCRCIL